MARMKKTLDYTETQFARVKMALARQTPRPHLGVGNLDNMGGPNGLVANRYAKATRGYMARKMAARGLSNG